MSWNWCCHVDWKSSSIFFHQHITSCYLVWDHIPFKRWQAARDMRTSTKSSYYETCAEVWAWLCSTHTLKWGENPKSVLNLGWIDACWLFHFDFPMYSTIYYIPFIKACPGIDAQMTQMLIDVYHSYANPFSATCWNMLKQSWGHLKAEPATHATWQVTDWWVVEECNKPCGGGEVGWGMRR